MWLCWVSDKQVVSTVNMTYKLYIWHKSDVVKSDCHAVNQKIIILTFCWGWFIVSIIVTRTGTFTPKFEITCIVPQTHTWMYRNRPKITSKVQGLRQPHQSNIIVSSVTVVAFMQYDVAHRVTRSKESAWWIPDPSIHCPVRRTGRPAEQRNNRDCRYIYKCRMR